MHLSIASFAALIISCGNDVAEEGQQYVNEEFGVQTKFPGGRIVCVAFSGDHPIGFYTWLDQPTKCNEPNPALVSRLSLTAAYNTSFKLEPDLGICRNKELPADLQVELDELAFANLPSARCVSKLENGLIEVVVTAQGGQWEGANLSAEIRKAPAVEYNAFLTTTPKRLRQDLAFLRSLLANTNITPPTRRS